MKATRGSHGGRCPGKSEGRLAAHVYRALTGTTRARQSARLGALVWIAMLVAPAQAKDAHQPLLEWLRAEWGPRASGLGAPAIEGYVYNTHGCRVGNVRIRIERLDERNRVIAEASRWVYGDIAPNGRAYFLVPASEPRATYRVTVLSFDLMSLAH